MFKQETTSTHDNASQSILNDQDLYANHDSSVGSCTCESSNVKESMQLSSYDYEVFLSFRGPDTRSGITDFLYTSLVDAGIRTFRDDEELRVGEKIGPELERAIKQAKISIPIFSKGYASSKWCLMELVQMVECMTETGQRIMPIFYDIAPVEVKYQTNDYGKAFDEHIQKRRYDNSTINKWKAALTEVGRLKGWDLASNPKRYLTFLMLYLFVEAKPPPTQPNNLIFLLDIIRHEGEFTKAVTRSILMELKKTYLEVSNCLVEVDSKVDEIMRLIGTESNETKIVGIYGLGGVGKTTLAKIVYNILCPHFQDCSFLANIRETLSQKGIECLQNQLISDVLRTKCLDINNVDEGIKMIKERLSSKKVLLLLDDVDKKTQLKALIGERNWYGKGSKLIITTRNKENLNLPQVDEKYELTSMDPDHSLILFSKHAFRRDHPLEKYVVESRKVVKISGGLPLALEVIGSLLYGKSKTIWEATLNKLEKVPHEDVRNKLMISFETLDTRQKNVFLDIACFFIGFDRRIAIHMWHSCDFFPEEAIEALQQMSLIKIRDDNKLWMHDQLRDLGRDIIYQESNDKLEKQSRIWDHVQAFNVLSTIKGKKDTEAICLKLDHRLQCSFTNEEFTNLPNLRFLQIGNLNVNEIIQHTFVGWRPFWKKPFFWKKPLILSKLRWLSWHNLPQDFKLASFSLRELIILDLSESEITENWDGWKQIKVATKLKVLNLTGCENLKRTPNFSNLVKLERLILKRCGLLAKIDRSIGQLIHLVHLDVSYCRELHEIPDELGQLEALTELFIKCTPIREIPKWTGMKKLEILCASDCISLREPSSIGYFTSLTRLSLVGTRIVQLPKSFGQLESLIELDLSNTSIIELPHFVGKMKKLEVLRLHQHSLETLSSSIGELVSLIELDLSKTKIRKLPHSVGNMKNLQVLRLGQSSLKTLPSSIGELVSLTELDLCRTKITKLPHSMGKMKNLQVLRLGQSSLKTLPSSIGELVSLTELDLSITKITELPHSVGKMKNLQVLRLSYSSLETLPSSIGMLEKLKEIDGENCDCLRGEIPSDIVKLPVLRILKLTSTEIESASMFPNSLESLCFVTKSMTALQVCSNLSNLRHLELKLLAEGPYDELTEDPSSRWIGTLHNLESLSFTSRSFGTMSEDINRLSKLKRLHLSCRNLRRLPRLPSSLSYLGLWSCEKLSMSIDLSNLTALEKLEVGHCGKIEEIHGLEGLENLRKIFLCGATCLKKLPDLTNMKQLRQLQVIWCGLTELTGTSESLVAINLFSCWYLEKIPDLSSFKNLSEITATDCPGLRRYMESLHDWRSVIQVYEEEFSEEDQRYKPEFFQWTRLGA